MMRSCSAAAAVNKPLITISLLEYSVIVKYCKEMFATNINELGIFQSVRIEQNMGVGLSLFA
jgi:hypothetical protein